MLDSSVQGKALAGRVGSSRSRARAGGRERRGRLGVARGGHHRAEQHPSEGRGWTAATAGGLG